MIKDVDIIIVSTTMSYFLSRAMLMWLTPENLPKSCIIVLRLPFTEEDQTHKMHSVDILKIMGLKKNGESISKKGKKNDEKKGKTTHQICEYEKEMLHIIKKDYLNYLFKICSIGNFFCK